MIYKTYALGELVQIKYGKNQKKVLSEEGTIPIYGTGGLMGYATEALYDKPSVLIGRKGTIGKVRYVDHPFWTVDTLFYTIVNTELVLPKYLFYLMSQMDLNAYNEGTTIPSLRTETLNRLEFDIPSIEEQKEVLSYLEPINDKIQLNTEINKNLADQIQAIYNNEFDPCTHTSSGVLADICSYSSDRIPVSRLSLSTYFSTENMQPNKMGYVDATSLPSITQTTGCHKGDVLISNIRPYFKKIVYVTDDSCGCSTDVLCFVPKEDQYSAFLFGTLYMDRFFDYMIAGSKGTKMPRGDKQQIMNYPIVLPNKESLDLFNGLIVPMLDQIATNRTESNRLAALRDTLLPKLMSGEIDLSDPDL